MPLKHTVQQGESVISLSDEYGLFANTVWNDPANAELKNDRKDMNVLMPGDILHIPDIREGKVEKLTGVRHVFRRKGIPAIYRLQVFDIEEPRANQQYRLTIDGKLYEGTTDEQGILEEYVPATSKEGELIIGDDEFKLLIEFGYMDPITEIVGVQKRLNNLGFICGEPTGELDDSTRGALLAFQKRFHLELTGEPDDTTLAELEKVQDAPHEFPPQETTKN